MWTTVLAGSCLLMTGIFWVRRQGKKAFGSQAASADTPMADFQYQLYFDSLPAAVFIWNLQGALLQANQAACRLSGYTQGELKSLLITQLIGADGHQHYLDHWETAKNGKAKAMFTFSAKEGKLLPVEVTTTLCEYDGQPRLLSVFRDVSEQVQVEAWWRSKQEMEKSITYFATSLYGQNTEEDILWDVAKNCISRLGFEDCVIYLIDEDQGKLVQKAAYGPKNPKDYEIYQPIEIPLGQGIVGSVAFSGMAEIINDTRLDTRYIADDQERLSEITVPVIYQGKVLGVIDSEHSQKGFFTATHQEILTVIAGLCANKIIKARAEQAAMRAKIKLAESHERMAEFKLMALRAQMNPHFVFNCLNAIQFLVATDQKEPAVQYLSIFARLIRQILDHSSTTWVKLCDELDLLKNYIQLEQLRLENPFAFTLIIDPSLSLDQMQIPPMLLHPYIENAILYGLKYQSTPGRLTLTIHRIDGHISCIIEDNGIGREKARQLKISRHWMEDTAYTQRRQLLLQETEMYQGITVQVQDLYEATVPSGTRVEIQIPLEYSNNYVNASPV